MTGMPPVEPDLAVPVNTPRPPLLKRLLLPTLGVAALVLAGVYAAHWWTAGRFIEATDDAYIGGDVTVIGPKVAGYIDEVLVTDNQKVKAGDVLIRLDSRDYRANLAKAEGAVAAEEALLANLDATEQLQQAVIGQGLQLRQLRRKVFLHIYQPSQIDAFVVDLPLAHDGHDEAAAHGIVTPQHHAAHNGQLPLFERVLVFF